MDGGGDGDGGLLQPVGLRTRRHECVWYAITIIPITIAILRYAVDVDAGKAAEPEDIVWGDRVLQGIGVVWVIVLSLGVLGV